MIIKEITIKNFRSYYGDNKFVFSDGLTLIVGDNGDGKTTFFDALQWLFNNTLDEKPKIDNFKFFPIMKKAFKLALPDLFCGEHSAFRFYKVIFLF